MFAGMVVMNYGVAWYVVTTLFEVIQKACHKIKTGYGVSNLSIVMRKLLYLVLVKVAVWALPYGPSLTLSSSRCIRQKDMI